MADGLTKPFFAVGDLPAGTPASLSDRFILEVNGLDLALIEGVNRPGYKIETESYQLLEYQINFPKTIKFDNTIKFTIIELLDPTVVLNQFEIVMSKLLDSNVYVTPSAIKDPSFQIFDATAGIGLAGGIGGALQFTSTSTRFNLSKKALSSAAGIVKIHTLDSDGKKYDSIRIVGAMITSVAPSALSYGKADINKLDITMTFD